MPSKAAKLTKLDFKEKLVQSGKGGGQEALLKRLKVRSRARFPSLATDNRRCTSSSRILSKMGQISSL